MSSQPKRESGRIVGATLCTHVPRLMMTEKSRAVYMRHTPTSFFDAFARLYAERIKGRVDTFVVFDTHWFSLTCFVVDGRSMHKGVYTSEEVPQMIRELPFEYRGDPALAEEIRREAAKEGVPIRFENAPHLPYHYPTLVPMQFLNPDRAACVLPTSIAFTSSVEDELAYGYAIGNAVRASGRRVVLVASGGFSHKFPAMRTVVDKASPDIRNIPPANRRFDQELVRGLKEGNHRSAIAFAGGYRESSSPEGRFAHYLRMVGALGGEDCTIRAEQFGEYEAAAGTGQAILWFENP
ncbi:hypothetical protein A3A38_02925 [Candidatus Kaiserbacteria bacterium RIFCSPLOWO2_01_FULL_53_17]|uniref:Extradiol ring-cleavage dioxygenase class III enzyme subunit B domain-containing protein n=1 Tax=Candidatus Kaiserbacteria bacterium RIFCSPLOWO2_01_FULL_53_17 TaxID=1798511 RepID=A0A1F6EG26_9BACT|nr:MAG: hypothetical protein A3A38_02925 [Candidatus Kaiserbacteria bacterium RIFCSPLOWO2_01_FULL_53_17]